jgi:hypothetical protein
MTYTNASTVKELKVIAKELGLVGYSALRKADLLSLVNEQVEANREARTDINIDNIADAEEVEVELTAEEVDEEVEQLRAALDVAYARIAQMELVISTAAPYIETLETELARHKLMVAELKPITAEEMAYERNKAQCAAEDTQALSKEQATLELFKDNAKARNLVPRHTCHNNSHTIVALIESHSDLVKRTQYGWALTLDGVTSYHYYATSAHKAMTDYFSR